MTIQDARTTGFRLLTGKEKTSDTGRFIPSQTPFLDTDCFLEHILNTSRTVLMAHGETVLTTVEEQQFRDCLSKRTGGMPVAYITGHKEFYGLDFIVTPDVLIPKPDTETLVEKAIAAAKRILLTRTGRTSYRIADICTGSGCIAVSVLHELCGEGRYDRQIPMLMTATDLSGRALDLAKKNAERLLPENSLKNIDFKQGDLFSAADTGSAEKRRFDLVLSNPPYIPSVEVTKLLEDGRSEPRLALDGDTDAGTGNTGPHTCDGLAVIRRLIPQIFSHLNPGGVFFMETGEYNAQAAAQLAEKAGFADIHIEKDLAEQLRVVTGRLN